MIVFGVIGYLLVAAWSWFMLMQLGYKQCRPFKQVMKDLWNDTFDRPDDALYLLMLALCWFMWIFVLLYWGWRDRKDV